MNTTLPAAASLSFERLERRASELGLAVRGGFHPQAREFAQTPAVGSAGTLMLLGFTGSLQWPTYCASPEASDGKADPLDRWSRRVIGELAGEFGATGLYPFGSALPFQRLATRADSVHQSPMGLLIDPRFGLWHAYRGALAFVERIRLPQRVDSAHPRDGCSTPCLSSCPVGAFHSGAFALAACVSHVTSDAGAPCRTEGCLARRACPVGTPYRYVPEQARFHLQSFIDALSRAS